MKQTIGQDARNAELLVTQAVEGIYRVERETETIGYVVCAGRVYVALSGRVYNTAVEVAQCLDLETAAERVARA